jgi:3-oxoadipate enol-lactonase / 4-carboxymuconolactone decarboxylase
MSVPTIRCTIDPAANDVAASELLVLGPSLGTTTSLWQPVVDLLERSDAGRGLRVLRFDLPGHGDSPATREAFSIGDVAEAVLRLVDETGGGRFHYAGISLGGTVGLELALRHPERLLSLTLFCTSARIGTPDGWAERGAQARTQGTSSLVIGSAQRWFAPGFLERENSRGSRSLTELTEVDDESYALCTDALAAFDLRGRLGAVQVPTLTVSGQFDAVTTPADLAALAAEIPEARNEVMLGASHLAVLEDPARAVELVLSNINRETLAAAAERRAVASGRSEASARRAGTGEPTNTDPLERGMTVRREVLGNDHVDRQVARQTPETAAFQDFITRYAWGDVWARPGLSRRERSIATLASLVTGGHDNEVAMHIRAALNNGLTKDEISEVLLHTALYAGLPASNTAFAIAREVFAELDASTAKHKETENTDG